MEKEEQSPRGLLPGESIDSFHLHEIENFGIWHLSIIEAAELIAIDMWFSGWCSDIAAPADWDGTEIGSKLLPLLQEPMAFLEERLLAAVDSGRLKAAVVKRDFNDDKPNPKLTYVSYSKLTDWLFEHDYECGDIMANWIDDRVEMEIKLRDEAAYLLAAQKAGKLKEALRGDAGEIHKVVIAENLRLKEQINHMKAGQPAKVDRPLHVRQRRTLLTIIAAFCEHAGLDPSGRGTAQRIKEMTDNLGTPIDDGTIAKLLAEIPDALESRLK